jgi:hypothetical protein
MMKVTIHVGAGVVRLEVEGRLVGDWVAELEKAWTDARRRVAAGHITVDLNAVSYVDAVGRVLLKRLHDEGAQLLAALPLTQALVEEITR